MQNNVKLYIIGIAAGEFEFEGSFYTRFVKSSSIFKFINKMVEKLDIIYRKGDGKFDIIDSGIDSSQEQYPVSAVQSFADVLYQHGKLQKCENSNNKWESIISIVIIIVKSFHYPHLSTFHVINILLEMQTQTFFKCNSITIESSLCL